MRYIYIIFSSTPNRVGQLVRRVTGEPYNHASIALDEDLQQMYSFARRYYRTPLYGGFAKESLSRFHQNGQASQISVCRLPVTQQQYENLEKQLTQMYDDRLHYLYNHLSALGALFHRRVFAKDAYTCIEFCVQMLHRLGFPVDPKQYYTVCDIEKMLRDSCVYTGPIQSGEYDTDFYQEKPVPYPVLYTLRGMFQLLPRLGK